MKKTISLIVALVMVFTMCIPAFAAEKPTGTPADGAALGAYYAEKLNEDGADITAIAGEIVADFQAGVITTDTIMDVFTGIANGAVNPEDAAALIEAVTSALGDLDVTLPDVSVPDVTLPDVTDPTLPTIPDDGEGEGDAGFLDSVLGILGSIADMIFGGGSGNGGEGEGDGDGDDAFGGDDNDTNTGDDDNLVADTGDTTVISVAAVALVAGAALVLTRKKSDEE